MTIKFNFVSYILFFFLLLNIITDSTYAQVPLYSDVPVSDSGSNNNIGDANTSRNIVVSPSGIIYVVYANFSEVRLSKSLNGGQSFEPSVLVANANSTEPEIAVNENGVVFVAWIDSNSLFFSRSIDQGNTFSPPTFVANSTTTAVHMSSFGSNVYLIERNGESVYSNNNEGIGLFNSVDTGIFMVYADVLVDLNGVVYAPMDNPTLRLFESTDQGATLTETPINPNDALVYFSSYALSDGPCGTFIFVGGGGLDPSQTLGYKIDVTNGNATAINLGNNNSTEEARTLYADNQGTLIDGYKNSSGQLLMNVSSDQGDSFGPPIIIASGASHNIFRNPETDDVVVVYDNNGNIFVSVYDNLLNNISLEEPDPTLSLCPGDSVDLNFTINGSFDPSTQITATLSDEFGDFTNATEIGNVTTNTDGTITITIPNNLPSSDTYRIQLESLLNCIQSNTISLTIGEAQISGPTEICENSTQQYTASGLPSDVGWSSTDPSIATIDENGLVTAVSVGSTILEYENEEGCTGSLTINVIPSQDSSFTVNPTCDGGTVNITGSLGGSFSFDPLPDDDAVIDSSTGTVTDATPGNTYNIVYTLSGDCGSETTQILNVLPEDDSSFTITPTCDGGTINITGQSGGSFSFANPPSDSATIDSNTGTVTNATAGSSYDIVYTTSGVCPSSTTQTLIDPRCHYRRRTRRYRNLCTNQ